MTLDITFDSDMHVDLMDFMGSDQRVVQAAQVSTKGAESVHSEAKEGLIRYLVNNRHASPTEHSVFTFLITAPIFVAREAHRHRIASLNEESGRYKELSPHFYVPNADRKLQQVGKTGDYKFTEGTEEQKEAVRTHIIEASEDAWDRYQELLAYGVTKEVSRMVLPVNIYTSWYITINARSLMNFLSLRTTNPDATIKSSPQREIEMVAEKMEVHFKEAMPITYKAWHNNGRKAI